MARTLIGLFAEIGIGKTTLMTDMELSLATSVPWLGAPVVRGGPTVHVLAEGADQFSGRVAAWKAAHGFRTDHAVGFFTVPEAVQLLDAAHVSALIARLKPVQPVLVSIDTLARAFVGGEENSRATWGC